MNRRFFLTGAAGALVLATGVTTFALTRTPVAALEPWHRAGLTQGDDRLFIVEHAVLAPNPHNRQPWLVELLPDGDMLLFCDLERRLPETDPFDRQIVIGLGCFVELAALAAAQRGIRLEVTPFPQGESHPRLDARPIAHLRLVRGSTPDPLFAQIRNRRSCKQPYAMDRAVPQADLVAFGALSAPGIAVATITDPAEVARIRDLTWQAWQIEAATHRTHMESVRLMRIGRAEIEANPDGISLGGPLLEALALTGSLTREALADPQSSAMKQGVARYEAMLAATPAYLTVTTADESRAGQLQAGRSYLRANLEAAARGLALHPVSQAMQEFPEMADTRAALEQALGIAAPRRLHMLARLGYGPQTGPTPRWPAESRIRTHAPA